MSQELIDKIVQTAKDWKLQLCEENKGPADVDPIIFGVAKGGEPFIMPDTLDDHPTVNLPTLLMYLAQTLRGKHGTMEWEWLAYVVEGYMSEGEIETMGDVETLDTYERGSFERDFKTNPSTNVKETIIANIFMWNGENKTTSFVYSYGDDGLPVWAEPVDADKTEGLVPTIFNSFRTFCEYEGDASKLLSDN
jgi:hypothetical protein